MRYVTLNAANSVPINCILVERNYCCNIKENAQAKQVKKNELHLICGYSFAVVTVKNFFFQEVYWPQANHTIINLYRVVCFRCIACNQNIILNKDIKPLNECENYVVVVFVFNKKNCGYICDIVPAVDVHLHQCRSIIFDQNVSPTCIIAWKSFTFCPRHRYKNNNISIRFC